MGVFFRITNDSVHIDIKAVPGASKTELAGVKDGRLRVRIAAAPEDGRANAALIGFFAKILGCPKREVRFAGGEKSRLKTLAIPLGCAVQLKHILEEKK
ncbi:MAG: DUF167 domain-containing protein [Treponema sp.]|jgi:uncharacterized protein (TIGR00251 family)|nr:DUF167 domain-containing protein [Treponema sp.]